MRKYNIKINLDDKFTYTATGCKECNNTGYYDRIGVFEILTLTDEIKELITKGASSLEIRKLAIEQGFVPLTVDAINKVINGETTLDEINKKLVIY